MNKFTTCLSALPLSLFVTMAGTHSSTASIVRVDFSSEVTQAFNLPIFGISPNTGDPISGYFTYDTSAVDLDPGSPGLGIYEGGEIVLLIGGLTITNELAPRAVVFDLGGNQDILSFSANDNLLVNGVSMPGSILFTFRGPLVEDTLPDPSMFPSAIDQFNVTEDMGIPNSPTVLFGNINSTSLDVIPEPSSALLTLAGLASFGLRRKR